MINNSEHQSLQKLSSFLQGLNKSIVKLGQSTNLNQISNNLDATASEIGFLLQGRDLNEYGQIVNKLSTVWKELYKLASTQKLINENDNEPTDAQLKLELIQQAKRQMRDGAGEIGQLGGVRVAAYQSPQPKSSARQLSRQQTGLPSIQRQFTTDQKSKMNYEIDESQRELLQEVLKQGNKLNVQIVMKRYDPKITLLISEGTDTDLDVQEAMRGFNKDYLEIKLNDITHENEKNIQEIQKVILDKHDFSQITESQASEKLKAIYKTIYTKTMEMDQIMIDAQKMEPQVVKNILDDFLGHVSGNYKEIQSETYKIVARMFQQIQQKQKQEELQKSKNLQVQPQHKKDKLSQSKRLQSSTDESQIQDKVKQELIEKKLEVDKKNSEINDLQSKVRQTESQYIQTALELESMKLNVSKAEQEKAQLLYEFKKMEKSLTTINSKIFMDQGVQCTDIGQQHLIQKLQKENTIYEQKIYSLKNELSKASPSPRSGRELKPEEKSDDQMIQNSNNGTPKLTSRYRSAYDIDYQYNEDGLSIDQRLDSSQQNFKQSEISNREREDLGFERSPTHSNTYQGSKHKKSKLNQLETRQTNSPASGSERSVKLQQQMTSASFNPKKKQKKSFLKIEEEDSTLNQSADLQKQKQKQQQSFSNKVTRRQTTLEVGSNHFIKQQKSVRDQDETQAGTNFETYRTESGQLQQTERTGGRKPTEPQGGRRIQTETYELIKDSDDSGSENNSKIKFSRSTTQKESKSFILKKGAPQNQHKNSFARKSTDQPLIDVVEEIPSNVPSQQNLDKFANVKKQSTIPENNSDQNSTIKKEPFKFNNASSPIRRSSTFSSQPQQLQMIIKLNDEDQQQYTTYWQQRHLEQETQTDFELLLQLIQQTIEQLDIPQSVKLKMVETLPSKLETAVNQLSQPGAGFGIYNRMNGTNETTNQDQTNRTSQNSRQSQESQKQGSTVNMRSTKSVGKQKLSSLLETNNQPNQTKTSLDQMSKIGQQTQKNSIEIRDSCNSDYGDGLMKSKGELESFQLDMQEKILRLEDLLPPDDDDLGYEELVKQIVANENGGAALEEFKPKDIQSDNLVKKMYINLTNKKTTGSAAVQEMLKKYYKKSPREQVSYLEFKGFYQKIAAIHKQCGYNLACIHLQRFMMRLGFTCSLFTKRKILKTSLSILKPFNPLTESKQKLISQNSSSQAQTRNKMNQYFSDQ